MATERVFLEESFKAEQDLSAKQHLCMELSAADQVDTCDGATDIALGILQNKPLAGEAANVALLGISKAVSDGSGTAIVAGDFVGTNNAGKVVKKTANNDWVLGRALDPSTADGTVIRVLLLGGFHLGA